MAEEKPKEGPVGSSFTELLKSAAKTLGPLLVSAVVSVGFVAFAGKAVLWTRFNALQVPGDQVVKAVPQSEAAAIGASMLLIFGLLGVLATLGVYLIDRGGRATPGMSQGLLFILGAEGIVAIWLAEGKSTMAQVVASEVLLLAVGGMLWATFVAELIERNREIPDLRDGEEEQDPAPRAFFREKRDENGKLDKSGRSGITEAGVRDTLTIALALGAIGYAVTDSRGGSHSLAWAIAIAAFGAVLLFAIGLHVKRFDREEAVEEWERHQATKAEEKAKEAAQAKAKREKEEQDREKEARARAAQERAEECGDGRLAAFWAALCCACRRDRSMVTVNVGTGEEDGKSKAGGAKPKDDDDPPPRQKPPGFTLQPKGFVVMGLFAALAIGLPPAILHEWWLAVALGAVAVLGMGLWRVADLSTTRFVWYGLAVFISVPLFGTVLLIARNIDEPQVQPMALIRSTDGPDDAIQGLYVTETSDRVYFANLASEGCEEDVKPNSGRLLWVPKTEVVAIAVGPLQSVEDAGRAAREMAQDLTPGVETARGVVDLPAPSAAAEVTKSGELVPLGSQDEIGDAAGDEGTGNEGAGDEGAATEGTEGASPPAKRLEGVGPAVKPNFGTGLRLEPETVSPGGEATLKMSKENASVEGFGSSRSGRNLRLGGTVVDIVKEPAGAADLAEYIKLANERLVTLGKEGGYVKRGEEDFELLEDADDDTKAEAESFFVRIDDPAVRDFEGEEDAEGHQYVEVEKSTGKGVQTMGEATVTLVAGTFEGRSWGRQEDVSLANRPLQRQAWSSDRIRFHVPEDARTGVVAVECDQLAGAPLLQVSHAPTARLSVEVQRRSGGVRFDSSHSSDEDKRETISRRWKINGVTAGHGEVIGNPMSPRRAVYSIELTVTDKAGNSDTAKLQLLRLPMPRFGVGLGDKKVKRAIGRARGAIEGAVEVERPTKIELDGYTDDPESASHNLNVSLKETTKVRKALFREKKVPPSTRPLTIEELAHGEACPLDRVSGRHLRNRHVDIFVLGEGVIVKHGEGCHPGTQQSFSWHPPPGAEPLAAISSVPEVSSKVLP